jgi:hypothetical protein
MFIKEDEQPTSQEALLKVADTALHNFALNNAAQFEYYTVQAKYTKAKHLGLGIGLLLFAFVCYFAFKPSK